MSNVRMRYWELAPEGIQKMRDLEHYLNTSSELDRRLLELVRLRASLLNECDYCIALHRDELRKLNETEERICVENWHDSQAYTPRERVALTWTEAVTNIQDGHASDIAYNAVRAFFSEKETVNLTLAIATINAWNRIAIAPSSHSAREVAE